MQLRAQFQDHRIDLDRGDLLNTLRERGRGVGAGARAENQRVLEGSAGKEFVNPPVERLLILPRDHALMPDAVDVEFVTARFRGRERDLVIGRPVGVLLEKQRDRGRREHERRGKHDVFRVLKQQDEEREDAEPINRREREVADEKECGRAREAAEDVEGVGGERRGLREEETERARERNERRRDQGEDQRQKDEAFRARESGRAGAEIKHVGAGDIQLEAIERDHRREQQDHEAEMAEIGTRGGVPRGCRAPSRGTRPGG